MRQGSKDNLPPPNLRRAALYYMGKASLIDHQVPNRAGFFRALGECLAKTEVTAAPRERLKLEEALASMTATLRAAHAKGGKVVFIGNGGSAAIASHMAVDFTKNGGIRAVAFNDAPMLTCLTNDFGSQAVFAKQLEYYATKRDCAVIVSSSGRSLNIVNAADTAREKGMQIFTFSGMNPNNVLRAKGNVNFYVPCADYGLVELAHLALLHSVVSVPEPYG